MISQLNGQDFRGLIDYGIRNLSIHREHINALNVFPVPDGDTGTNMVMTLQNGFAAIDGDESKLSVLARKFANAVVFGARGNSGVIVSQFFKGFCEQFFDLETADCRDLAAAFERGVGLAYGAVSNPVEGTILTVVREASQLVREELSAGRIDSIDGLIDCFRQKAEITLAQTPELLSILKSAGVVDSGGSGIVRIFEGMGKYLNGEPIEVSDNGGPKEQHIDYSRFDRKSRFEFGYCTELLLQLTDGKADFSLSGIQRELSALGESIVTAFEDEKLKVHIHSFVPEKVLALCHEYGEFLSVKIENMSVQHSENNSAVRLSEADSRGSFAVVAAAHDPTMRERFFAMGADAVISADRSCPPSASDFISAFERTGAEVILVFPNSKNSVPAALQAGKLYDGAKVLVFDTRSDAECYAALPMLDFEETDTEELERVIRSAVENMITVTVTKATRSVSLDGKEVREGDYVALAGHELVGCGEEMSGAAIDAVEKMMSRREHDVVRIFANSSASLADVDALSAFISESYPYTEVDVVTTEDDFCPIAITFE